MHTSRTVIAVAFVAACNCVVEVGAQPSCAATVEITAADRAVDDFFGQAVALDGDVLVVGAPYDDDDGNSSGSAYVYRFDGGDWVAEQKLHASDAGASQNFGRQVEVRGDSIFVNGGNSVYVFEWDGSVWAEVQIITGPSGARFGHGMDAVGDLLLVGAMSDDVAAANSGSAFVFRFDGAAWMQEQKLVASDGSYGAYFGIAVALAGNQALIGASSDDEGGLRAGALYVFDYDGVSWSEAQKILGPRPDVNLGLSLASAGGFALVGGDDDAFAMHYDGSQYSIDQEFLGSGRFGWAVGVAGDALLITDSFSVSQAGRVSFYYAPAGTWTTAATFVPPTRETAYQEYGYALASQGTVAAIGAPGVNRSRGCVYVVCADPCARDFNGNGVIGVGDLGILLSHFGTAAGPYEGDLNMDGQVNLSDLGYLLSSYGQSWCP